MEGCFLAESRVGDGGLQGWDWGQGYGRSQAQLANSCVKHLSSRHGKAHTLHMVSSVMYIHFAAFLGRCNHTPTHTNCDGPRENSPLVDRGMALV